MISDFTFGRGIGQWLAVLQLTAIASAAGTSTDCAGHPVLGNYPSPQNTTEQIRRIRSAQPGVVEQILADFDLSIRSSITLRPPSTAKQREIRGIPHVQRDVTPGFTYSRSYLERELQTLRNDPDAPDRLEFFERHFDEYVLEDHQHLGLVMMHVLADRWHDWSAWDPEDDRLSKARDKFPDLHRINALSVIEVLRYKPAIGLILRTLNAENDPLGGRGFTVLRDLGNYEDVLQFYIACALESPNTLRHGHSLWSEIRAVMGKGNARLFWEPYLESDVPTLWYCANLVWDRPLPEAHWTWVDEAQSEWNYQHERDPKIRRRIELGRKIAEIRKRESPETGRISLEDHAQIQALEAEIKRLEDQDRPPGPNPRTVDDQ